jgi:hypothetical protein
MAFTLAGFGPFLHWLTLLVLCLVPVLGAIVLYKLGRLPGAIAAARGHPQAAAINVCGWMGILIFVLWPVALIWAYTTPKGGLAPRSAPDVAALVDRLKATSHRLAALESRIAASQQARGGTP